MFLSVRALILSRNIYKESDYILQILSKEHGIIRCVASGAAKPGGRFSAGVSPGYLADFVLSRSKNYWYVKEIEIVEAFRTVQEDICYLTSAAHMLEIAGDVCVDVDSSAKTLLLILHAFYAMHNKKKDYQLVVSAFEWRIMSILGLEADFEEYTEENRNLHHYAVFSFPACRLIYKNKTLAYSKDQMYNPKSEVFQILSDGATEALSYLQHAASDKVFSFTAKDSILNEIEKLTHRYLCDRLEKNYKKMQLLSLETI